MKKSEYALGSLLLLCSSVGELSLFYITQVIHTETTDRESISYKGTSHAVGELGWIVDKLERLATSGNFLEYHEENLNVCVQHGARVLAALNTLQKK